MCNSATTKRRYVILDFDEEPGIDIIPLINVDDLYNEYNRKFSI